MNRYSKPKLLNLIVCDRVKGDPESGELSLIDVTSIAFLDQPPKTITGLTVFMQVAMTKPSHDIGIRVIQESSGKPLLEQEFGKLGPTAHDETVAIVRSLDGFDVTEHGYYVFEVYLDGKFLDSRSIRFLKPT